MLTNASKYSRFLIFVCLVTLTALSTAAQAPPSADTFISVLTQKVNYGDQIGGSGANSKNSTPYGGVKEVRVASFPSFQHIER